MLPIGALGWCRAFAQVASATAGSDYTPATFATAASDGTATVTSGTTRSTAVCRTSTAGTPSATHLPAVVITHQHVVFIEIARQHATRHGATRNKGAQRKSNSPKCHHVPSLISLFTVATSKTRLRHVRTFDHT